MSKLKGVDFFILHSLFKEQDPGLEAQFLSQLSPPLAHIYQNSMANDWVPLADIEKMYEVGARTFFPMDPGKLSHFARMVAARGFSTIYKVFLLNLNTANAVKRIHSIWNIYHVQGKVQIPASDETTAKVVVSDYPELTGVIRQVFSGQLMALMDLAGAQGVHVVHEDADAYAWSWRLSWK